MNTILLLLATVATMLTTEYRVDPIGIDATKPRLSWKLPVGVKSQSAYELEINGKTCGIVESDNTLNVEWPGVALKSGERVEWRVRFWDERGKAHDWSEVAHFTTAIMNPEDWLGAKWIGMNKRFREDERFDTGKWIAGKIDAKGIMRLKKTFTFDGKLKGAEYVKLVHLAKPRHVVTVNGKQVYQYRGHVNGWNFAKYNDITKYLKEGENTIEIDILDWKTNFSPEIGDGDSISIGEFASEFKHVKPEAVIAEIRFPDGRVVGTDESWEGGAKEVEIKDKLELRLETKEPAFAKVFAAKDEIERATLFITGLGYYEARLNGMRVGEKVLDPSPTEFDHRVMYSTYHVEDMLKEGENRLDILVGHGWYDITTLESWDFSTAPWKDTPKMIAKLDIEYKNGEHEIVISDASWRQVESPLRYDCVRDGEIIDARLDVGADLAEAAIVESPKGVLVAENQPGSKIQRRLKPVSVREVEPGIFAVKFAENIAGWAKIRFEDQDEGDIIEIRYDERSYEEIKTNRNGRAIDSHVRSKGSCRHFADRAAKFQSDLYICRGKDDVYEPRFTYNGFQYLLIKGLVHAPVEITACVIHTDFKKIGEITTSNADLNALLAATENSYCANFANGYPMDCPHREKNGWTGDASIASELAQYMVENTIAYEKYVMNICDTQNAAGDISCIAPSGGWGFSWGNGPGWDSAMYTIAWNLYLYRGDDRILDKVYPHLAKYLTYTATKADAEGLVKHGLGDWIPVVREHMPATEFTSSCYYLQAQRIAAKIAMKKGLLVSAMAYEASAAKTRAGIRAKYMKEGGVFENGGQTAQAMALAFGLYEQNEKSAVIAKFVESVEKTDCHVDMGLFGSKWVFRELARNGRADLAFKMLLNPTAPTMLDWLKRNDGKTLWEDWDDGLSRNHIMFGDFYAVAYQYLAGIRLKEREGSLSAICDVDEMAFMEAIIAPNVIDSLDNITATLDTPCGIYQSAWERKQGKIEYFFEIPSGCRAEIHLPGRAIEVLGPGRWTR